VGLFLLFFSSLFFVVWVFATKTLKHPAKGFLRDTLGNKNKLMFSSVRRRFDVDIDAAMLMLQGWG